MKTRVRRIFEGGQAAARNAENVDRLMVVDGTEIPEDPSNELTVEELNLEKKIAKLKQDHGLVLAKLHDEVDRLKRQNQGLQFLIAFGDFKTLRRTAPAGSYAKHQIGKLTTNLQAAVEKNRAHSPKKVTPRAKSDLQPAPTANQNLEISAAAASAEVNKTPALLEKQIVELMRNLKDEKCLNIELMNKLAGGTAKKGSHESGIDLTQRHARTLNRHVKKTSKKPDAKSSFPLPFDAQLEPFLVDNERPPTVEECEAIIRTLKDSVDKQSGEITDIRTDLKDVFETHTLTPESFLLAKYYAQETTASSSVVKCTCNQRKPLGRQPTVVSLFDHAQWPTEKLVQRARKSGFLFGQIACNAVVR